MSEPLKRDADVKLPDGVEQDNVARKLLKPLYGLSTACEDWCGISQRKSVCGGVGVGGGGPDFPR